MNTRRQFFKGLFAAASVAAVGVPVVAKATSAEPKSKPLTIHNPPQGNVIIEFDVTEFATPNQLAAMLYYVAGQRKVFEVDGQIVFPKYGMTGNLTRRAVAYLYSDLLPSEYYDFGLMNFDTYFASRASGTTCEAWTFVRA